MSWWYFLVILDIEMPQSKLKFVSRLMKMRNLDIHDPLVLHVDYLWFWLYILLSLIQIIIISVTVIPVFTARVRGTMRGYVFTGVCLFREGGTQLTGSWSLVPGPFPWGRGGRRYSHLWSQVLSGARESHSCPGTGQEGKGILCPGPGWKESICSYSVYTSKWFAELSKFEYIRWFPVHYGIVKAQDTCYRENMLNCKLSPLNRFFILSENIGQTALLAWWVITSGSCFLLNRFQNKILKISIMMAHVAKSETRFEKVFESEYYGSI